MTCFRWMSIDRCSFCKKRRFKLYDIPVYSDIHSIFCSMTQDSYLTCWKCLYNLLQKHIVIISLKSIVKDSVISYICKDDISISSHNKMCDLQNILKQESEYHEYSNFLTEEENKTIKKVLTKINTRTMC